MVASVGEAQQATMNYIWIFLHFITISIKKVTYYVEKEEIINLILFVLIQLHYTLIRPYCYANAALFLLEIELNNILWLIGIINVFESFISELIDIKSIKYRLYTERIIQRKLP